MGVVSVILENFSISADVACTLVPADTSPNENNNVPNFPIIFILITSLELHNK